MFRVRVIVRGKLATNSRIHLEGADVNLPEGARVRDLLVEVGVFDEEVKDVKVNGRRGRLDQALRRNDMVELSA
jgi:sulfur carrier protein ThiS